MNNKLDLDQYSYLVSDKVQELIIFPTEQCNFRCTYCYEDFQLKKMSPSIVQAIKNFLDNRAPKLNFLTLSWFGGEPLVAKDIVLDISKYANYLSNKYEHLSYFSVMTTNGYLLTPSTFEALVKEGVTRYQISLDGPKSIHNLTRIKANGEGTFEKIWDNLLYIRSSDHKNIQITLRIHLTQDNLAYMSDFMLELRKQFVQDPRFKIFLKPIARLGGPNDSILNLINKNEKESIIDQLKSLLYQNSPESSDINDFKSDPVCYASKPNSIAIRSDGSLAKCTVALQDEQNNIGNIELDGILNINQNRLAPWLRGVFTLDSEALACPLSYLNKKEVN
ncbi:radical SAM protein [Bacillus cereus]|uniref:radical SAM protein n=1 Tax=Bacillus cereus TaxID=1396 RepID=UPI001120AE18|nr:radical SAM protein [Bacillus cereus]UDW08397.1 radical SAM protein [Bacillus cereus]